MQQEANALLFTRHERSICQVLSHLRIYFILYIKLIRAKVLVERMFINQSKGVFK